MTKTVEIYFDDLKPEAQAELLVTWDTSKILDEFTATMLKV